MKIGIYYDEERLKANGWFAETLKKELENRGCEAFIAMTGDFSVIPDVAVMRATDYSFSKLLEAKGVRVVNNSKVSRIANDKVESKLYALGLDVPVMQGFVGNKESSAYVIYPKIVKSRYGHGGTQVYMVNNHKEYAKAFRAIGEKTVLIEDVARDFGKDLRVYVMGGKILCGVLRTSETDFRSNYSLGGKARVVDIPDDAKEYTKTLITGLDATFIGVDFVFDKGRARLNEIEDVVGCRMLYDLNVCDAVELYADEILKG